MNTLQTLEALEINVMADYTAREQGKFYGCDATRTATINGVQYEVRVSRARVNTAMGVIDGQRRKYFIDGYKVSRAKFMAVQS